MTDREKQIEEMAMSIAECNETACENCALKCSKYITCEILHDNGYRKMNDTVVVLKTPDISPEELEHIKNTLYNDGAVLLPAVPETIDIDETCKQAVKEFCEKLKSFIIAHTCVSDKDVNTIYHGIDMIYAELYEKDTDNV